MLMQNAMLAAAILIPLVVGLGLRNKWRAVAVGALAFYGIGVAATQYSIATDPNYDSFAPAAWVVIGWVPAILYSGLCATWGGGGAPTKGEAEASAEKLTHGGPPEKSHIWP